MYAGNTNTTSNLLAPGLKQGPCYLNSIMICNINYPLPS